jgi:hypothetical protein
MPFLSMPQPPLLGPHTTIAVAHANAPNNEQRCCRSYPAMFLTCPTCPTCPTRPFHLSNL